MELVVALLAFAGALLAGITTGVLVNRLRGEPAGWLVAWSITTGALTLSLGAIAIGHLAGFGGPTFRALQITGSLLAPLWLAVGVMQLLAEKASARFSGWLIGVSVTVVGSVIMLLDPLAGQFTKQLPDGPAHWDIWPEWLLRGVHGLVILMLLISLAIAMLSWRDGDDYDVDNMNATVVLAPAGMALSAALELTLPGIVIVALMAATAGGIWYAVARPLAPYDDEDDEDDDDGYDATEGRSAATRPSAGARSARSSRSTGGQVSAAADSKAGGAIPPRRSGLGDLVAEYRAGEQSEVDYAARMRQHQDDFPPRRPHGDFPPPPDFDPRQPQPDDFGGPATGQIMVSPEYGAEYGPEYGMPVGAPPVPEAAPIPEDLAANFGVGFGGAAARQRATGSHAAGQHATGQHATGQAAKRGDRTVRPAPGIYGLLTVFTLLDGSGEAFDKLAEETVEAVRRNEPDTLVFVCHAVKSAPLQRIVYELYRDEVGYTEHQRQPHMERFVTERQPLVLAANVIELSVNAAKVVPLPTALF
ncbi:putative quinol monooxygenase [Sphaerimonospora cavernae]|uniref:Quinol monooxygenase n=1 Tax=Sphaerimonospora cavernae TaxID=1740611 RepID=A0ABV6UAN5_9ACTN